MSNLNTDQQKNTLQDCDLAYIAGFFDGEGHIGISHSTNGNANRRRIYRLQVGIAQKPRAVLDWMQSIFGGWIYMNRRSEVHQLNLASRQAENFLRTILPYLKVKQEVAKLALQYRSLVSFSYKKHGRANLMPVEISAEMARLRDAVMQLNRA